MEPGRLRDARRAAGLTQQRAARQLGVSQAYLSLIEGGHRPLPERLGKKVARLYRLGPAALTLRTLLDRQDSGSLAGVIAALGYPGFGYMRGKRPDNPAGVILAAIAAEAVEVRIIEALPWIMLRFADLDWEWLIREAKLRDAQNRLGFLVSLARGVAEKRRDPAVAGRLREVERVLERARLAREDALCQEQTDAEREWLRRGRSADARHWNLLTDMSAESLPYAA